MTFNKSRRRRGTVLLAQFLAHRFHALPDGESDTAVAMAWLRTSAERGPRCGNGRGPQPR